jgi:hypothetical protein
MTGHFWQLLVRIEGEWEQCGFDCRSDAQSVFCELLGDYPSELEMAVLIGPDGELANLTQPKSSSVTIH